MDYSKRLSARHVDVGMRDFIANAEFIVILKIKKKIILTKPFFFSLRNG